MGNDNYSVPGFDAAGVAANIKKDGRPDLALIASETPCRSAAVFTRNAFAAAPVLYDQKLLSFNPENIHGVLINSGNANACTGTQGAANTKRTAETVEKALGVGEHSVHIMSTGVIGVQLPMDALLAGIPKAVAELRPDGWEDAAKAIMTTDTVHKVRSRSLELDGGRASVTGICKGAGMIHPDMATMLSVIATDARIAQPLLQQALDHAVAHSFNRISVDGDTSTNDTVLLLANGIAEHAEITDANSRDFRQFQDLLTGISVELAQALVRDGEGATKFITIRVEGGASDEEAHRVANTVATSPLCKTAFYGNDANWGRLVMAIGRSGARVDPQKCSIWITGSESAEPRLEEVQLIAQGEPTGYRESDAMTIFSKPEIDIRIDLGLGTGSDTIWTSDFSHEYVTINAEYRT